MASERNTGSEQGQVRNLFPSYRVFVGGQEVTALVSSVRISWPAHSPMQCTLELANPDSLMTITAADMAVIQAVKGGISTSFNAAVNTVGSRPNDLESAFIAAAKNALPPGLGPDTPQNQLQNITAAQTQNLFFQQPVVAPPVTAPLAQLKSTVVPAKLRATYIQSTTAPDGSPLPQEVFFKYPFYQGKWIWHTTDPVRVAFRHPSDPTVWYWVHAGTVTDLNEKQTEDLQSTLTLTSEGVLKDLRNARIQNLTGAFLSPSILQGANAGVTTTSDEDLSTIQDTVPFSNFLQNLTLSQILEILVFGVQSVLADFGQAVKQGLPPAVIAERFGLQPDKTTGLISDETTTAFESRLKGLNIAGLGKFKRWRGNQGTQIEILGGPLDPVDQLTGEFLKNGLSDWQSYLDNRVTPNQLQSWKYVSTTTAVGPTSSTGGRQPPANLAGDVQAPSASMTLDTVITTIGTDPDTYPIRQRVLMLLPAHLGSTLKRDVIDHELAGCPASTAEYFDRLSLLQQVLDRIDFVLYDSPTGDVVVEMPLYDFEPRHFTPQGNASLVEQQSLSQSPLTNAAAFLDGIAQAVSFQRSTTIDGQGADLDADGKLIVPNMPSLQISLSGFFQGPGFDDPRYDTVFCIYPFEQISIDIQDTEQDVKTVWVSVPRLQVAQQNDPSKSARHRVVTVLPNLIPLYGFRVEQGDPMGQIVTDAGARIYNMIMLNKANADVCSIRLPSLPNFGAWPNRPVYIAERNIIATTRSIGHTIAWQSDCSTEYNFWHPKFWDGRYTNETDGQGNPVKLFQAFGGVNAAPYNYAYLLEIDSRERILGLQAAESRAAASQAKGGSSAGQGS